MKALLWLLLLMFFFIGCGKEEKEVKNVITSTTSFLTQGNCQAAIDTINSIPYQAQNYLYVKAFASAYACRAGFSVVPFYQNDLSKIGTPSILGGMARFTNASRMAEPRAESFEDLQIAIDSLLYIGGIDRSRSPTPARRRMNFSADIISDVHSQLLYMLLDQLGKYTRFYGNTNASGEKGQGGVTINECFLTYQDFAFDGGGTLFGYFDNATTSSCNPATTPTDIGHPALMDGATIRVARACQGIVLFNNFRVVLVELLDDLTGNLDIFADVETAFNTFDTVVTTALGLTAGTQLTSTLSQSVCEESFASNPNAIQTFFVGIYDTLLEGPP